jgi:DNA-binding XRE family transcriptional regulator
MNPKFLEKLRRRGYRKAYLRDSVTSWIVYQIQALREQREWTQGTLAKEAGTSQPAIARAEKPDYGKWNLSTLIDLAAAFDVGLQVRFVDWPTFVRWTDNVGSELYVPSFSASGFADATAAADTRARKFTVTVQSGSRSPLEISPPITTPSSNIASLPGSSTTHLISEQPSVN